MRCIWHFFLQNQLIQLAPSWKEHIFRHLSFIVFLEVFGVIHWYPWIYLSFLVRSGLGIILRSRILASLGGSSSSGGSKPPPGSVSIPSPNAESWTHLRLHASMPNTILPTGKGSKPHIIFRLPHETPPTPRCSLKRLKVSRQARSLSLYRRSISLGVRGFLASRPWPSQLNSQHQQLNN